MGRFVGKCIGHETVAVGATPIGLSSVPSAISDIEFFVAVLQTTERIRAKFDGSSPTSTNGFLMLSEDIANYDLEGKDIISNLKMIRVSDNAIVNVTYFSETYRRDR